MICNDALWSVLSWHMVGSVHAGLDFDLGICSWSLLERRPKYRGSLQHFSCSSFPSLCWSLGRSNSRPASSWSYPCVRKSLILRASRLKHMKVWISQAELLPWSWTPVNMPDFPSLAGVSVPVHAAFWQKDGAWCSLYGEGWIQTKMIFPSNVFHTQTIHRIPVTERQRNQPWVLHFAMKLCPKLNMAWGGGGSSHITYF